MNASRIVLPSLLLFLVLLSPRLIAEEAAPQVLRHIVLFEMKPGTSEEALAAIEAAAYQMKTDIEVIQAIEWGQNIAANTRNQGFEYALLVTFASEEDLAIYGPHPGHDAFKAVAIPHVEQVLVVDYFAPAP